jgi:hypothetical protein
MMSIRMIQGFQVSRIRVKYQFLPTKTTAWRILSAAVILFVLQCIGAKDACIFAQTAEDEPGRVHNEKSDYSQVKPNEELPSVEPPAQHEPELIRETVEPVKGDGSA